MATLKDQIMTIHKLMQRFENLNEEVKKSKQKEYDAIIQDITDRINTILGLTGENQITLKRCIELVKSIGETENNDGGGVTENGKDYIKDNGKVFDFINAIGIKSIESDTFSGYENVVEEVKVDVGKVEICKGAFGKCEKLKKICTPLGLDKEKCKKISDGFDSAKGKISSGLVKIYGGLEGGKRYYYSSGSKLKYSGNDIEYPNNLSEYESIILMSTSDLNIAGKAFDDCKSLEMIQTNQQIGQCGDACLKGIYDKLSKGLKDKVGSGSLRLCYNGGAVWTPPADS